MATLTAQTTVGEIARNRPASVRVFERYHIDFCCGGNVPLDGACLAQNLQPGAILAEIEAAEQSTPNSRDWTAAPLGDLIDHILDAHHAYLKAQLPRLETALAKIENTHRYAAIPAVAPVLRALSAELDSHLMKEEMVLFPLIRTIEKASTAGAMLPPSHCGSVRNPVRVMCMEHDNAGEALAELRRLTGSYKAPEEACNTMRAFYYDLEELERDLHRHIHLENNILFPRAIDLEARC